MSTKNEDGKEREILDYSLNLLNINPKKSNNNLYRLKSTHNITYSINYNKKSTSNKPLTVPFDISDINKDVSIVNLSVENDQFIVIKSFSAQDVYNSIKHKIWCSTENGNIKLNEAFKKCKESNGQVYLFFSVNGSGHFCGIAQMMSEVDLGWKPDVNCKLWSHSTKWKGKFYVKWLYVKNVPNRQLSYIKLENNENKPVTHSRDCQNVPPVNGLHIFKIIQLYHHYSSILDNFQDYE